MVSSFWVSFEICSWRAADNILSFSATIKSICCLCPFSICLSSSPCLSARSLIIFWWSSCFYLALCFSFFNPSWSSSTSCLFLLEMYWFLLSRMFGIGAWCWFGNSAVRPLLTLLLSSWRKIARFGFDRSLAKFESFPSFESIVPPPTEDLWGSPDFERLMSEVPPPKNNP